jgi:hypothetical protein
MIKFGTEQQYLNRFRVLLFEMQHFQTSKASMVIVPQLTEIRTQLVE